MKYLTAKTLLLITAVVLIVIHSSCKNEESPVSPSPQPTLEELFQESIIDAMSVDSNEISNNLIPIIESNTYVQWTGTSPNKYVLVATLIKSSVYNSYRPGDTITTWWGDSWVTVVPEIKDFFTSNPMTDSAAILLRAKQLLGLNYTSAYSHIIELWVKPADIFRPAPDNEITDKSAGLYFPATADSAYKYWFNNNLYGSYFAPGKLPWTRLGYTYDWGSSTTEIGLSEYVIRKNSSVIVKSRNDAFQYLKKQ